MSYVVLGVRTDAPSAKVLDEYRRKYGSDVTYEEINPRSAQELLAAASRPDVAAVLLRPEILPQQVLDQGGTVTYVDSQTGQVMRVVKVTIEAVPLNG